MLRLLIGTTCLLGVSVGATDALAAGRSFRIENWSGAVYHNEQTKQFERCSATAMSRDGVAVTYTIDKNLRWHLSFSNEGWSLSRDFQSSAIVRLDDKTTLARAIGTDANGIEIQPADEIAFFANLRTALALRASVGALTINFDVANSGDALSGLAECAVRQTGLVAQKGKDAKKTARSRAEQPIDKAAYEEASELAIALNEYARVPGFKLIGPISWTLGPAGISWRGDLVAGAVFAVPAGPGEQPGQAGDRILAHDARECPGGVFFVRASETIDQAMVARIYIACKMPESTTITYYTVVPRDAGGFYVLATISSKGFATELQRQTEALDDQLRAVALIAIRRMTRAVDTKPDAAEVAPAAPAPADRQ